MRQIDLLDMTKLNSGCVPARTLKATNEMVYLYLNDYRLNNDDSNHKVNYRPISVLPLASKIYERVLNDQRYLYFKDEFSRILFDFREGYSTQRILMRLIENWGKCLDASDIIGAILMHLSKA